MRTITILIDLILAIAAAIRAITCLNESAEDSAVSDFLVESGLDEEDVNECLEDERRYNCFVNGGISLLFLANLISIMFT